MRYILAIVVALFVTMGIVKAKEMYQIKPPTVHHLNAEVDSMWDVEEQWCNVSAYTSAKDECGKDDGITASMTKATAGRTIAADHLPFGTKVMINNHIYIVEDRFGGGYTDRIDIFMNTKKEAFKFGRQQIKIKILKEKYQWVIDK